MYRNVWAHFVRKIVNKKLKNCPIWSHWRSVRGFNEAKQASCSVTLLDKKNSIKHTQLSLGIPPPPT